MRRNKRCFIPAAVFVIVFIIMSFLLKSPTSSPALPDLELIDSPVMNIDGGLVTIDGKVRNNTEYTYEDISLSFILLDSNDEEIGKATAELDHLYGTNVWAYEAFAFFPLDMDIESYELKILEGTKTNEVIDSTDFVPAVNTEERLGK